MSRLRRALMPEYRAFVPDVFPNGKSGSTQLTHHHPIPHIPACTMYNENKEWPIFPNLELRDVHGR